MTTERIRKPLRRPCPGDNLFDVHTPNVNTVHADVSTENVHTPHTIVTASCDNAAEMPDTSTRLRQLRRARRVSQSEVAAAVDVDRSMISKMEAGLPGGRELVVKLAEYYGVSIDWLLAEGTPQQPVRTSPLSDDEAKLIEFYRSLPEDVAEAFLRSMQAAAKKR